MSTPRNANLIQPLPSRLVFWAFLTLLLLWPAQQVKADEIAIWNFNDSDLVVDHGTGTLSTNFNLVNVLFTQGGTTTNARQGDVAGQSMTLQGGTSNANNGAILVSMSARWGESTRNQLGNPSTSTGFNNNQLHTVCGVLLSVSDALHPANNLWTSYVDLSSVSGLNKPECRVRLSLTVLLRPRNNRIDIW